MSNREIIEIYLNNGLIKRCVDYQFAKFKGRPSREDFFQDLVLSLLEYDNEKMNDAHFNNHFNALLTRIIQNNLYSTTSPYYKTYVRFSTILNESGITREMENTISDEE